MSQTLSQIFSYTFVFLFGMIVGAVGELLWAGRFGKKENSGSEPYFPQPNQDFPLVDDKYVIIQPDLSTLVSSETKQPVDKTKEGLIPADNSIQPLPPLRKVERKPARALTIIEQVDEILQDMQRFSKRGQPLIKLEDDGHQNVIVKIGNQSYPGIDSVPDQEAISQIRLAVSEWEKRYTK